MTFGQRMPDFYPQRDAGDVTGAEALTRTAGTFLRASARMLPPDGASLATQPRRGARLPIPVQVVATIARNAPVAHRAHVFRPCYTAEKHAFMDAHYSLARASFPDRE
jgi:hypothetical protein